MKKRQVTKVLLIAAVVAGPAIRYSEKSELSCVVKNLFKNAKVLLKIYFSWFIEKF